jgi:hypothetical protein
LSRRVSFLKSFRVNTHPNGLHQQYNAIETGMYFTANNRKRLSFKFQQALDENVLTDAFIAVFFFFSLRNSVYDD